MTNQTDIEREDVVAAVIDAAGGQLTAKVRLQKAVYLLEELGLSSGFAFEYHHYGPYSRDLDNAVTDAKAFDLVDEKIEHRTSDGASYSVFELKQNTPVKASVFSNIGRQKACDLLGRFARTNVTVLELAATMHFLCKYERRSDWLQETKKRKAKKASPEKIERATSLLQSIHLYPACE